MGGVVEIGGRRNIIVDVGYYLPALRYAYMCRYITSLILLVRY